MKNIPEYLLFCGLTVALVNAALLIPLLFFCPDMPPYSLLGIEAGMIGVGMGGLMHLWTLLRNK